MEWYEVAFDRFYPVLYGHRDAEEAHAVVRSFLPSIAGKAPVLDLACGDGRYLDALSARGEEAYGLDLSLYLLLAAVESEHGRGRLVQADMRHLPFADDSFGAIINMFTSFGYFSIDTDNLLVFREVHRVLRPQGVFLFDFINASRISGRLLEESRREAFGFEVHERRRIESHGKYLVKRSTIVEPGTDFKEVVEEKLRLYGRDELLVMFTSVGLSVREIFGDYLRNPFVEGVSDRIIIVSEKT